jgi:hypothetical protein
MQSSLPPTGDFTGLALALTFIIVSGSLLAPVLSQIASAVASFLSRMLNVAFDELIRAVVLTILALAGGMISLSAVLQFLDTLVR